MARYEHLPIYKAALDVAVGFEKLVVGFSRYHQYTLGSELRNGSQRVLEQVDSGRDTREGFPTGGPATAVSGRRGKWVGKVQSNDYWSGTAYAPDPASNAWNFNTNNVNQNNHHQNTLPDPENAEWATGADAGRLLACAVLPAPTSARVACRRNSGARSYAWVKNHLQAARRVAKGRAVGPCMVASKGPSGSVQLAQIPLLALASRFA